MTTVTQGSEAWHLMRLGKITASRVNDVVAMIKTGEAATRADYRIELVCERLTAKPTEGFTNSHMERGIELEPFARTAYEIATATFVDQVAFVDHPRLKNTGASPDGLVGNDGLIEIKCPAVKTHIKTLVDKKAPSKYMNQMQWQMACTKRLWVDFVSYCPELPENMQLFVKRVERDNGIIAELEAKVLEFDEEVKAVIQQLKSL